ncbi:MAG: amidohydrolase family protein [Candidatus Wallbacteria bacterium]|nr:amidohydrolase family protein [Candidatus Wallbacteria bacterium]
MSRKFRLLTILIFFLVLLFYIFSGKKKVEKFDAGTLAGEVVIFRGEIVNPDQVIENGAVVVNGRKIAWAGRMENLNPGGRQVLDTGACIYPGFIDSHNHLMYNFLPRWKPGKIFKNRYDWQDEKDYRNSSKKRAAIIKGHKFDLMISKYGEIKEMISGATMVQGTIMQKGVQTLVRNLESYNLCKQDSIGTSIFPLEPREKKRLPKIIANLESGRETCHLVHAGEGVDDSSRQELYDLRDAGLLRKELVIIHGTAFGPAEFKLMADAGVNLVWSPRSNLELYNTATRADQADKAGITLALAPDWSVTGSDNILEELHCAAKVNTELFQNYFKPRDLFRMITINPARMFGFGEYLGSLEAGKEADLAIIRSIQKDPYQNLLSAEITDVLLVVIHGEPYYGLSEWMEKLGKTADYETLEVRNNTRAMDITEKIDVPEAGMKLIELNTNLKSVIPDLNPLAEGVLLPLSQTLAISTIEALDTVSVILDTEEADALSDE